MWVGFATRHPLGRPEGHLHRAARGRAHRRRERAPGLPPHHPAAAGADDRRRRHHDRDHRAEDIRHRLRHDERPVRHRGHRHSLFYHARFIDHDAGTAAAIAVILLLTIIPVMLDQHPPLPGAGGHAMTTGERIPPVDAAAAVERRRDRSPSRRRSPGSAVRAAPDPRDHRASSGCCRPSRCSSARSGPPPRSTTTGWWNAFRLPFQFTLENYRDVLTSNNIGTELPEQPAHHDPGDRHPDHDRRLRGLRLRLDGLPRPQHRSSSWSSACSSFRSSRR